MPSIDVAMARSVQGGGAWEKIRDSVAGTVMHELGRRDIIQDAQDKVSDIRTALSSWDNCMAVNFCKYPVIAVIVVGSLILLSIVACIVRCACCAKSCCCSCFKCFKCCGNCCGCCDSPEDRKKHKHLDEPYGPAQGGYKTEPPMHHPFPPVVSTGPPQYAEFDVSKKRTEDSLPQMPSWEASATRKVSLEDDAMEMNNLNGQTTGVTDSKASLMRGASPNPSSSLQGDGYPSPYGQSQQGGPSSMANLGQPRDLYDTRTPTLPQVEPPAADPYGPNPSYDAPAAGMAAGIATGAAAGMAAGHMGRNSPAPTYNSYGRGQPNMMAEMPAEPVEYGNRGPYGPGPSPASPAPAMGAPYGRRTDSPAGNPRGYGMRGPPNGRSATASPAPYGMDPRMRNSPGPRNTPRPRGDLPYGAPPRHTPTPQHRGEYGQPAYSPTRENFNRSFSPAPVRQYAQSPGPMNRATPAPASPSSPIVNNAGFDFTSGYSRPSTGSNQYDRRPSESREPSGQEAYPGYKPYQAPQQGWTGV